VAFNFHASHGGFEGKTKINSFVVYYKRWHQCVIVIINPNIKHV